MEIAAVDDDPVLLHTVEMVLERDFGEIATLEHPQLLMQLLQSDEVHVVILDLNYSKGATTGGEGLAQISKILEIQSHISIIILTAHSQIELAVKAVKLGAVDFLEKPFSNDKLRTMVRAGLNLAKTKRSEENLRKDKYDLVSYYNDSFFGLIGESSAMKDVYRMIERVADTDASVLILGEHGTGKQLIARTIHQRSQRSREPFIEIDLASVNTNLFESEFFGHERGSFTDAREDRTGKMELSNMGTLLLHHIGELELSLQSKLLSALQSKAITKIGGDKPLTIDSRIISTAHPGLLELVKSGQFRQDLLYRINTIVLELPSLGEREGDIQILGTYFLNKYNRKYGKELQFAKADWSRFEQYSWPGNVRELEHTLERAVIMADQNFDVSVVIPSQSQANSSNLYETEKSTIRATLTKHQGNISKAAKELGIGRNTLYRKIRKYEI